MRTRFIFVSCFPRVRAIIYVFFLTFLIFLINIYVYILYNYIIIDLNSRQTLEEDFANLRIAKGLVEFRDTEKVINHQLELSKTYLSGM